MFDFDVKINIVKNEDGKYTVVDDGSFTCQILSDESDELKNCREYEDFLINTFYLSQNPSSTQIEITPRSSCVRILVKKGNLIYWRTYSLKEFLIAQARDEIKVTLDDVAMLTDPSNNGFVSPLLQSGKIQAVQNNTERAFFDVPLYYHREGEEKNLLVYTLYADKRTTGAILDFIALNGSTILINDKEVNCSINPDSRYLYDDYSVYRICLPLGRYTLTIIREDGESIEPIVVDVVNASDNPQKNPYIMSNKNWGAGAEDDIVRVGQGNNCVLKGMGKVLDCVVTEQKTAIRLRVPKSSIIEDTETKEHNVFLPTWAPGVYSVKVYREDGVYTSPKTYEVVSSNKINDLTMDLRDSIIFYTELAMVLLIPHECTLNLNWGEQWIVTCEEVPTGRRIAAFKFGGITRVGQNNYSIWHLQNAYMTYLNIHVHTLVGKITLTDDAIQKLKGIFIDEVAAGSYSISEDTIVYPSNSSDRRCISSVEPYSEKKGYVCVGVSSANPSLILLLPNTDDSSTQYNSYVAQTNSFYKSSDFFIKKEDADKAGYYLIVRTRWEDVRERSLVAVGTFNSYATPVPETKELNRRVHFNTKDVEIFTSEKEDSKGYQQLLGQRRAQKVKKLKVAPITNENEEETDKKEYVILDIVNPDACNYTLRVVKWVNPDIVKVKVYKGEQEIDLYSIAPFLFGDPVLGTKGSCIICKVPNGKLSSLCLQYDNIIIPIDDSELYKDSNCSSPCLLGRRVFNDNESILEVTRGVKEFLASDENDIKCKPDTIKIVDSLVTATVKYNTQARGFNWLIEAHDVDDLRVNGETYTEDFSQIIHDAPPEVISYTLKDGGWITEYLGNIQAILVLDKEKYSNGANKEDISPITPKDFVDVSIKQCTNDGERRVNVIKEAGSYILTAVTKQDSKFTSVIDFPISVIKRDTPPELVWAFVLNGAVLCTSKSDYNTIERVFKMNPLSESEEATFYISFVNPLDHLYWHVKHGIVLNDNQKLTFKKSHKDFLGLSMAGAVQVTGKFTFDYFGIGFQEFRIVVYQEIDLTAPFSSFTMSLVG